MSAAADAPDPSRPFVVVADGPRRRIWGRYSCEADALAACRALARHGMPARIERPPDPANDCAASLARASGAGDYDGRDADKHSAADEIPQAFRSRRAFLIWACMVGAVPPQRVVERVISEIESEATS